VNTVRSGRAELVVRTRWSARMIRFGQGRYNLKRFHCRAIKIFEVKEVQRQAFLALTFDKYGMIFITACRVGPADHLQATA
jgi:hypothetical protein